MFRVINLKPAIGGFFFCLLFSFCELNLSDGYAQSPSPIEIAKQTTLQLTDIFQMEYAADPQISPDGKTIVYVRTRNDIMKDRSRSSLWMIDADGKHLPLLSTTADCIQPRWSPGGDRLIFISKEEESSQIFCYWIESRRKTSLTHVTEGIGSLSWSGDGEQIAFTMRIPGTPKPFAKMPAAPKGAKWAEPPQVITDLRYRSDGGGYRKPAFSHLFVIPSEGGTPRQITHGDFDHSGPIGWIDDNSALVFSANRRADADFQPANSELYRVDLAGRKITELTDRNGPDSNPSVSPDGKKIAYTGYDDKLLGYQGSKLYVMNSDGTDSKLLVGDLDRSIGQTKWMSSEKIAFTYDDWGQTKLACTDMQGKIENVAKGLGGTSLGRPYGSGNFSVSADGNFAINITTPDYPAELATTRVDSDIKRLTNLNDDLFKFKKLGKTEEIRFKSSHDELDLQGWIIYPPDFDSAKKYPLILEIHGGPFANYGSRFTGELQLMAAAGYVVFYMNPRGSTSYGAEFANEIHHKYPGNDYDDLISGVDAVIKKGAVDEENLFVTGGSGGGVLTAWIVGKTDRFRAAVVCKPVINWYSFALTADMYNYFYKYWFPGFPWDHPEAYMKRSPISLVGNVSTPTMLLTGTEDYRTPMSETEQYYQALKLRKIDTALVRIPGASHGIAARPSRLIAKVVHVLHWFETHKSKEKDAAEDAE